MKIADLIPENELKEVVLSEYKRRLVYYRFIDAMLKRKYGMTFEEFEEKNIIKERDFSWEVERDAMQWEHAIEGIRDMEEKIKVLKDSDG